MCIFNNFNCKKLTFIQFFWKKCKIICKKYFQHNLSPHLKKLGYERPRSQKKGKKETIYEITPKADENPYEVVGKFIAGSMLVEDEAENADLEHEENEDDDEFVEN